jgi:AcrR family transcriptional regulator
MVDTAVNPPGGRTARVRAAVLDATVAELVEHGYAALSVEGVAARAGVNKTTVYRRWGSKDSLIVDAVETFAVAQADVPDSGDVDEDLQLWARSILRTLTGPVSGALVRAVFGGAGDSPPVTELRHRFWLIRAALVRPVVERAVQRGQLPAGTDADEVIKHVGAPLYYRLLVLAEPLTPEAARLAGAATAAAAHAGVFVRPRNMAAAAKRGSRRVCSARNSVARPR